MDHMTGGEFRTVREYLGLTLEWVAEHLDVAERSVRRWEAGTSPIPDGVRRQMEAWEADTARAVTEYVTQLQDMRDPAANIAEDTTQLPGGWPPRWHRHVVARAAAEVPGLVIGYAWELDEEGH